MALDQDFAEGTLVRDVPRSASQLRTRVDVRCHLLRGRSPGPDRFEDCSDSRVSVDTDGDEHTFSLRRQFELGRGRPQAVATEQVYVAAADAAIGTRSCKANLPADRDCRPGATPATLE